MDQKCQNQMLLVEPPPPVGSMSTVQMDQTIGLVYLLPPLLLEQAYHRVNQQRLELQVLVLRAQLLPPVLVPLQLVLIFDRLEKIIFILRINQLRASLMT